MLNLIIVTFKMWAYSPKITEIGNFWYKFAQKWHTPLSDFYNIWLGGGSPRSTVHTLIPNLTVLVLKMWVYSPQNRNFWYTFTPIGKFWGPQKKLNIVAQLQTFLYNDTIIVLKITLPHSISVITNFVMPKRDKKQPARDPRSPPYLAW